MTDQMSKTVSVKVKKQKLILCLKSSMLYLQVVEYDSPSVLLDNPESALCRLVEASQVEDVTDFSSAHGPVHGLKSGRDERRRRRRRVSRRRRRRGVGNAEGVSPSPVG